MRKRHLKAARDLVSLATIINLTMLSSGRTRSLRMGLLRDRLSQFLRDEAAVAMEYLVD